MEVVIIVQRMTVPQSVVSRSKHRWCTKPD